MRHGASDIAPLLAVRHDVPGSSLIFVTGPSAVATNPRTDACGARPLAFAMDPAHGSGYTGSRRIVLVPARTPGIDFLAVDYRLRMWLYVPRASTGVAGATAASSMFAFTVSVI